MRLTTLVFLLAYSTFADRLPTLNGTTLSGTSIQVPGDSKVTAYILSFGFSHKSDKAVAAWDKRIAPSYSTQPRVAYYEIAELQGLPGFVKPMVLHGMRRSLPKPEHARFVTLFQEEPALKKIVGYTAPEDAYIVVATSDGKVVWTSHAQPSDAEFAKLQTAVAGLLK